MVFFTILCKNLIEEVAYCKVPDAEMAGVFPPVLLQWEIIHADGSSEKIPESPKETMALPLDIVVSEAYSGSRLIWWIQIIKNSKLYLYTTYSYQINKY